MKAAEHTLTVGLHPPSAVPQSSVNVIDFERICTLQLEQLASQLPVVAAWVVYKDLAHEKRQWVTYQARSPLPYDPVALAYIESQDWLTNHRPLFELNEVQIAQLTHTYLCLWGYQGQQPEYLLIWTVEALSEFQHRVIERQVRLLSQYLTLQREYWQQQAEIQLMEQILQRTEHQLRNPLALISLYAENLAHQLPVGASQEQVTVIRDTVNTLTSRLKELLDCGQRSRLRLAIHDLREIIEVSISGLRPWLDVKGIRVCYPDRSAQLSIDRWQIQQVFDNLLSNAMHFSPANSTITCHWQVYQQEVLIIVRDQGPGLTDADLKQIFTPFYSRRPGGTGLGLAIAKKIILDHHGHLWADNVADGGAQFSMTLPK